MSRISLIFHEDLILWMAQLQIFLNPQNLLPKVFAKNKEDLAERSSLLQCSLEQ